MNIIKINLQTTSISFSTALKLLSINKKTYINALQVNFNKPIILLQKLCKQTNPFGIHVGNLWQANINVQFILDLMLQLVIAHFMYNNDKRLIGIQEAKSHENMNFGGRNS